MLTCRRCGQENPDIARFCLRCGEPLAEPEERRVERKYATVLFADIVGSTSLAEREDAEVVQSVVGRAFDRLSQEIARYEGLVEKFMGDAVLAVFGVPRVHEDDPERAVRAALEMQAILSELNQTFAAEGMPELQMRIGIESGEILVDQDRAAGPRDRMLTGDAVNVAARLQSAAEPGRALVGPSVFEATKETIEYRALPAMPLKGKSEDVPVWQVLRIHAQQRGERPQLGMQAALVGRDEELAVLEETLRRVQGEGRPALVTVIGPAGVGKSRLTRELEGFAEGLPETVYWRRGRCFAYGNTAYSALADAVKAQCEILEDDPSEVATQKAERAVVELFGDDAVAPQVKALVGAGDPGSFSRDELFDAWRRFLERMAARYPLVLAFEDIHWADAGLLDFIDHLADWAQGPIMILGLARPELFDLRPAWGGGKRNAAAIYLDPLSEAESGAMLADLLATDVSAQLVHTISERSEGNPLYVEEIVRKLVDDGVITKTGSGWEVVATVEDVEVPRSIHGLISARLDALPMDEKEILQDASVVGRVFWAGAVASLSGRASDEVRAALGRLRVKELVVPNDPSSFSGEMEFLFRHALIRDGAYESLPKSTRATKHEEVARWAEARAGDRAEEFANVLATHLVEAVRYHDELGSAPELRLIRQAYRWSRTAADRALQVWLPGEAAQWYEQALDLGERAGEPVAEQAAVALALLRAGWGVIPNERVAEAGRRAIELSLASDDPRGAGRAHTLLILIELQFGRPDVAEEHGREALALLEPLGESADLAEALHRIGWLRWRQGGYDAADLLRRAADMARRVDAPDVLAGATHSLALESSQRGRSAEALGLIDEAFGLAHASNDRQNLLRVYTNFASLLATDAYDLPKSLALAREGLELSRRAGAKGFTAWQLENAGSAQTDMGDLDEAVVSLQEALDLATEVGDGPLMAFVHQDLARALAERGRLAEAREHARLSDELLHASVEIQGAARGARLHAVLARADGDEAAALDWLRSGVAPSIASGVNADPWLFFDLAIALDSADQRDELRALVGELETRELSPATQAAAALGRAFLTEDAAARAAGIRTVATTIEQLGAPIMRARTLLLLVPAMRAIDEDPTPVIEQARAILVACGAELYLPAVDAAAAG